VVVVIAGANGAYAYNTVLSMIAMLEAQLLPKRIIRIYEEGGSIVQSPFSQETRG